MSHPIYEKYRSVVAVNDDATVHGLLERLVKVPGNERHKFYGASAHGGRFYLMRNENYPNKIIEYVPDHDNDTSVTTLYEEHPIFESLQKLIEVREEIIAAIDQLCLSVPGTMTVLDEGRNKMLTLAELGTAQLLDTLHHFSTK